MASRDRWHAASGYVVILLGIAGAAFERGAPAATAPPQAIGVFFSVYRTELLLQSLMFVFSAGAYLWFFGSLRSFLLRTRKESEALATIAFGAGMVFACLQMLLQSLQAGVAFAWGGQLDAVLAKLLSGVMWAVSVIAYVPLAVALASVAASCLARGAGTFPAWLGWLSLAGALAHLVMAFGLVVDHGLLVPGGVMTYALYGLSLIWLAATTTLMVMKG